MQAQIYDPVSNSFSSAGSNAFARLYHNIQLLLPDVNEVPEDFPAVVLWRFREASLAIQIVLWGGIGLGFGWLTERAEAGRLGVSGGRLLRNAAR